MNRNRIYKYKDKLYRAVRVASMKNPHTGEWQDCAIYYSHPIHGFRMYVRELKDFESKFKECHNDEKNIESQTVGVGNIPGKESIPFLGEDNLD